MFDEMTICTVNINVHSREYGHLIVHTCPVIRTMAFLPIVHNAYDHIPYATHKLQLLISIIHGRRV